MEDNSMDNQRMIDDVDGMVRRYGATLVGGLFDLYGHDPGLVAFALTVGHRGTQFSIEAFADDFVRDEGWLRDMPMQAEDFFDTEGYANKYLLTGPERMFDCLFDGSQYHFFDKVLIDDGISKEEIGNAFGEIEYDNNELPSAEPTLPARMVSNASQLKAMDCDELAAWLQAQDADPFDAQVKRNLSAFLGIDIVAMRRHRLLTPAHLVEWRDPDVPDILSRHYGPLVDTAAAVLTKEEDIEKRIYLLTEGADGVYENPLDMVIALNTGQPATGKMPAAGLGQTMNTMARKATSVGWDSPTPYYVASHPKVFPTIGRNDPLYPVTMINKEKVNNATHDECVKAAEKALAKIRSKEHRQDRGGLPGTARGR